MHRRTIALAAAAVAAFAALALGASCARSDTAGFSEMAFAEAAPSAPAGGRAKRASMSLLAESPAEDSATPDRPAVAGRKLVYRADMSVEVDDPAAAEEAALLAVGKAGGYAAVRQADESSVYLELRVPVAFLEPLMDEMAGAGKTRSRSVSAQDVTDSYFDLAGRLKNARLLEERYREYLRKASSVEDMLAVEARLSETTGEIERLEGSFRDLGERIELATLTLSIRATRSSDPSEPTLGESLSRLFSGFAGVLRSGLVVLVGLVVYGVPAVLALAALWWLTFGKLGLARRLFSIVRARPGRKASDGDR